MSVNLATPLLSRRKCPKVATKNGKNHGKLSQILPIVPLTTVGIPAKSPLVRQEVICAASGAQCIEQCGVDAMRRLNVRGKEI